MPDEWWIDQPAEHPTDDAAPGIDLGHDDWQPYSGVINTGDIAPPVAEEVAAGQAERAELSAHDWERLTGQPAPGDAPQTAEELLTGLAAHSSDPLLQDLVERLRETYG